MNNTTVVIPISVYIGTAALTFATIPVCLTGNVLVVLSVAKFSFMRSATNAFIVMLACFDFGIGLFGIFEQGILLKSALAQLSDAEFRLCKSIAVLIMVFGRGDLWSVCFIALDRFIFIWNPLRYYNVVTCRKAILAVVFTVAYSVLTIVPLALTQNTSKPDICYLESVAISAPLMHLLFAEILVVAVVLIAFYGKIAHLACVKLMSDRSSLNGQGDDLATGQLKVTRMLALVIGVFATSYFFSMIETYIDPTATDVRGETLALMSYWVWKVSTVPFGLFSDVG